MDVWRAVNQCLMQCLKRKFDTTVFMFSLKDADTIIKIAAIKRNLLFIIVLYLISFYSVRIVHWIRGTQTDLVASSRT